MPARQPAASPYAFPIKKEYTRCVLTLKRTGILSYLPKLTSNGVIGINGKEYPVPTLGQVVELFSHNSELVARKVPQGFDRLEVTPMAMPSHLLIKQLKTALLKHAAEGKTYQTRKSNTDPLIPVRVDSDKTIWMWDTLSQVLDTDETVYFPQEYVSDHGGDTKLEVITDGQYCAIPGWSVGLVESLPIQPAQGKGRTLGGRRQLEIGLSPREYLGVLQTDGYQGETGKTIEDFIIEFLTRMVASHEISYDRQDNNALWLLGQYVKYVNEVKSDLVPTGWWHRDFGRLRLDAHRPGNKRCTHGWGGSTIVRLHRE
jgi:hypothetical protein